MKIKWMIAAFLASATVALGACSTNDHALDEPDGVYLRNGNTVNVKNDNEYFNARGNGRSDFGFVRNVKSPVPGQDISMENTNVIDREKTASFISKLCAALPDVRDCSVLVTDEEVLVAYNIDKTDSRQKRMNIADQVKKTALSAIPRWYHVYVTDDPSLRQNVANLAAMSSTSANRERNIRDTITLMLERSPQGRKVSDGENANGELTGGMNDRYSNNDYGKQLDKKK